jgi:hypothetical protein
VSLLLTLIKPDEFLNNEDPLEGELEDRLEECGESVDTQREKAK